MKNHILQHYQEELNSLEQEGNLRSLPSVEHSGRFVLRGENKMLNLSSNDYLGLSTDIDLKREFLASYPIEEYDFSASSSRLLTGNNSIYQQLENKLSDLFNTESALVFNSGYHMNIGILPAITNPSTTLILADKLVHASLIDGIKLSGTRCIRYRHNNYSQLDKLLRTYHSQYDQIIIVTESIFSMDGDEADLKKLVEFKKTYPGVLLYIDEAHAIGVRGKSGLGCAEEQMCVEEIDFLTGTFGKALNSVGGYLICKKVIREYLVNKMRSLIFTTALPPVNLLWSLFILEKLPTMNERREHLHFLTAIVKKGMEQKGYPVLSGSHIIPLITGESSKAILKAGELQEKGFYVLPVRPPTVPQGSSRLRISLTSAMREEEIQQLIRYI